MKNHVVVNGKLLQTNKKFSDLKQSQQDDIRSWIRNTYRQVRDSDFAGNPREIKEAVVSRVMEKIRERDIWIPEHEIRRKYESMARSMHEKYNTYKESM